MKQWYAVYTQPRSEELAAQHLERQGFAVFLPRYLKRRSHARRVEVAPAPLFPRYLFTTFDAAEPGWRAVGSTRGVVNLVGNGRSPIPVPEAIINGIEHHCDEEGYVVLARRLDLKRGMQIRIDIGAFKGIQAIFEAKRDADRVVALLSLMGREVVVQLPIRSVVPA